MNYIKFTVVTLCLAGIVYQLNSTCVKSHNTIKVYTECWDDAGFNHLQKNHKDKYTEKEIEVALEIFKRIAECAAVKLGFIDENCKFNDNIIELLNNSIAADDKTADTIYLENMKCFKKYPNNTKDDTIKILYCISDHMKKNCPDPK
ncbi:hypothetical protein CHUAL_005204 [Chamberlinius hualienensis]